MIQYPTKLWILFAFHQFTTNVLFYFRIQVEILYCIYFQIFFVFSNLWKLHGLSCLSWLWCFWIILVNYLAECLIVLFVQSFLIIRLRVCSFGKNATEMVCSRKCIIHTLTEHTWRVHKVNISHFTFITQLMWCQLYFFTIILFSPFELINILEKII